MKKHWNETNRNEINRQRDVFTNLQQSFNLDSIDEKRLSVELSEQTIKHVAKVKPFFIKLLIIKKYLAT